MEKGKGKRSGEKHTLLVTHTLLSVVGGRLKSYKNSRHFSLDTFLIWQQHAFGFLEIIHLLVIRAPPQKLFPIQPPGWRKTVLESTILPMCVCF